MTEILERVQRLRRQSGGAASALELLLRATTLPMASRSDLESRVRAILDPRRNHRSLKRKTCFALITLALLLVVPCAILRLGYAQKTLAPVASRESQVQPAAGKEQDASGKSAAREATKSALANSPSASLDRLIRQVRENEALYRNLDCTVHTVWHYEVSAAGATGSTGPTRGGDVSSGDFQPITMEETNRTVTAGDRLYFAGENITSAASRRKAARKTDLGLRRLANRGDRRRQQRYRLSRPGRAGTARPAALLGDFSSGGQLPALSLPARHGGHESVPQGGRLPTEGGFNKVESQILGEEAIDGLECVKVRVKRWYYTKSPPALQDLWLAKQRNFHVAQCRTSSSENGRDVPYDATRA